MNLPSITYTQNARIDFVDSLNPLHFQYPHRCVTVIDACVREKVAELLSPDILIYPVEGGEGLKTLENLEKLLHFLTSHYINRQDCLIAVGGGSVSDFVGFAASIYKRGMTWYCIPTTLTAQIDAAIGGKTALNLSQSGKNMLGSFCPPERTIIAHDWLQDLPNFLYKDGLAEAIKMAVLKSPPLFEQLHHITKLSSNMIHDLVRMKLEIIADDWQDKAGNRCLLNLGHTFGHIVEELSAYTVSHGEAVGLGMLFVTALNLGEASQLYVELETLLKHHSLPTAWQPWIHKTSPEDILNRLKNDKKNNNKEINFIIPRDLGDCIKKTYTTTDITYFLKKTFLCA